MVKTRHEFRDPIHAFVRVDSDERRVIDSWHVQRLRYIHQLATTYLVYPGATHRRFEHALGTMELAGRVYDVVTSPSAMSDDVREMFPEVKHEDKRRYWRRVVRLAGLCHDIGHLPFSHAAEHELLPVGWSHELMSRELILSLSELLLDMTPPVRAEDVVKIAVGPDIAEDMPYTPWETMLTEIIVGDAFGVDRMDYLLRDSLHTGVAYGRFDHDRLIDTLRILPLAADMDSRAEFALGVESGGLQSAEALLMARYLMFSQVYYHPVRMIYDQHLIDFLSIWLDGTFPVDIESHLSLTDNEVTAAILEAANSAVKPGHKWAKRLAYRDHFKVLDALHRQDLEIYPDAVFALERAVKAQFGPDNVRMAHRRNKGGNVEFPVLSQAGDTVSSVAVSSLLPQLPVIAADYIYVDDTIHDAALTWLKKNRNDILTKALEEEEENE